MRRELDFFKVDGRHYGGDQNWSRHWIMRIGGCSTVTACELAISLARMHRPMRGLYPCGLDSVSAQDFMEFADSMFPFVGPGAMGLTDIEKYASGLRRFAASRGAVLHTETLPGDAGADEAFRFIQRSIDAAHPVAYLMLRHWDPRYDELEWHWFTVTGYDDEATDRPRLICATYGQRFTMDMRNAWDTRRRQRGGLVSAKPAETPASAEG